MRPTSFGWKALAFHGLLTLSFYVSPYANLFFLLLSFFAALLTLSVFWTATNVRGLVGRVTVHRAIAADVAGGPVDVELQVRRGRRSALSITLALEGRSDELVVADVEQLEAGGAPLQLIGAIPALPRGVHRVRGAHVRSSAPTGFWCARTALEAPQELVVHAAPTAGVGARGRHPGDDNGSHGSDASAAIGDAGACGLREWRDGDAIRTIDWRATARRRVPVVREFDEEIGRTTSVRFDRRCSAEQLERGLSDLVTLALRARDRAEKLEVRTQGMSGTFGESARPIEALLRWTATASVAAAEDAAPSIATSGAIQLPAPQRSGVA